MELGRTQRGWLNEPRNLAAYLARWRCVLHREEIGQKFGMGKNSTVGSIVTGTAKQRIQNRQLRKRVDKISQKFDMCQAKAGPFANVSGY